MPTLLSELADNTSGIFNSIEFKSCIEKIKIDSECCFVELKNNRLIYKCKECKKEWKIPLNKLIEWFPSIYQFCEGDVNKFVISIRKGAFPYEYMDSWEKFNEASLTPKEAFYSNLNLELDPAHFASALGLAWQACLKKTKVELELLTNIDMLLMTEKGIRGGICQSTYRYAKANNKYMKNYNKNIESWYIEYLDTNNLYG